MAGDPSPRVTGQHSRRPQATGPDSGGLAGHRGRLETTGSFWVLVTPSDLDLTEMSLLRECRDRWSVTPRAAEMT